MSYIHYLTPAAINDLKDAVSYYDLHRKGLGKRMANEVDDLLGRIAARPTVFSKRYRNIRAAKVRSFPYLIYYNINDKNKTIQVLRIFNTYQKPIY